MTGPWVFRPAEEYERHLDEEAKRMAELLGVHRPSTPTPKDMPKQKKRRTK